MEAAVVGRLLSGVTSEVSDGAIRSDCCHGGSCWWVGCCGLTSEGGCCPCMLGWASSGWGGQALGQAGCYFPLPASQVACLCLPPCSCSVFLTCLLPHTSSSHPLPIALPSPTRSWLPSAPGTLNTSAPSSAPASCCGSCTPAWWCGVPSTQLPCLMGRRSCCTRARLASRTCIRSGCACVGGAYIQRHVRVSRVYTKRWAAWSRVSRLMPLGERACAKCTAS